MLKIVPHSIDFNFLLRIDSALNKLLKVSAFLAVITLLVDITKVFPNYNEFIQLVLNSFTCLLAIAYFITDIAFNYFFQSAEIKRRKDFIDNSLGTHLSEQNSIGYFSNESKQTGIFKLGLNCFENSLFTKTVSSKMFNPLLVKLLIVVLGFVALALFTDNKTLTTVLQLSLPLTIIQQAVKLYFFKNKIESIYNQFYTIFSSTTGSQQENLIINNVINYESTLAWGSILLDSKIFDEVNPELSILWEDIKNRLSIP